MIAETLQHRPFALTAAGILLGTALIAMRSVPLAAVGVVLIVGGLLVPLIRFWAQGTVSSVELDPEAAEPEPAVHFYTSVAGDTLASIAQRFYGDENQWPRIFNANRDQIDDPDEIFVGQILRIPLDDRYTVGSDTGLSWFVLKTFGPPLGSETTAERLLHRWEDETKREGYSLPETLVAVGKHTPKRYTAWSAGSLHHALRDEQAFLSLLQSLAPGTSVIVAVRAAEVGPSRDVFSEWGTDDDVLAWPGRPRHENADPSQPWGPRPG